MRQTVIFGGSSHPQLVTAVCTKLAMSPGKVELKKFSNGETSVQLQTSIRNQDVFIIQSGSPRMNDSIMELLIMISACKGGSARSITAVMPYFCYSRQSKKKAHRGSITAKMIANLLHVAGVNHIITVDLHAVQMQGFFKCPVDNLVAEPLVSHWIRHHHPSWRQAVIVSKNPGGTKRVTSLADALKLSFGIVTTDRRRNHDEPPSSSGSVVTNFQSTTAPVVGSPTDDSVTIMNAADGETPVEPTAASLAPNSQAGPAVPLSPNEEGFDDQSAPDVIHGVLVGGHIVEGDAVNDQASFSNMSSTRAGSEADMTENPMVQSFMSSSSQRPPEGDFGGSVDGNATDEEEEANLLDPMIESTVTLVGDVRGRPVFIVDDMIDKPASWTAAAETCVKRGGALEVICIATHGLFSRECIEEMERCECISNIVVTNSFPIPQEVVNCSSKLIQLDVSRLLAEAIRRNKHGESMSQLFLHYD